ncbi:MAG: HAMP domain-containing protein [Chloroflexi bacterium]|nr:HAMP domain-containing protein [Chloroflexota bacterium]MCL5075613.1 HAMP domain-containing protein [Chloroflexota bacterium]
MKFSTRIILTTTAIIVVMGLLTMISIHTVVQNALRRESSDKGLSLAQVTGESVANALLDGNWFVVQNTLDDLTANNPNLIFAYVIYPSETRVIHTLPTGFPADLLTANRLPFDQRASLRLLDTERGPVRDVAWRILDGLDAELHLGFSEQEIVRLVNQVTLIIAGLTFLGVLVGSVAALGLGRRITRPLEGLTAHALRLGQGHLDKTIDTARRDEIGDLARAFNQMARDLHTTITAMRRRNRELAALNAVATATSGPLDVQQALERALTQSLAALELSTGWVFLTNGGPPRLVTCVGLPAPVTHHALPGGFPDCLCGQVLRHGEPMMIQSLGEKCAAQGGVGLDGQPLRCHATVPVRAKGKILGVLSVASADPEQIGEEEMLLLEAVGRQMGVALENAQLWEELEAKERVRAELLAKVIRAQEEERKRIARELHDQTGQSLNALVFGLKTAEAILERDAARAGEVVARLRSAAADSVRELQTTIYDLRPSVLDDLGLIPALRWFAESRIQANGIAVTFDLRGPERRLPADIETALFRIAQEALTNVIKHASARHVHIVLDLGPEGVRLEIADDGIGFEVTQVFAVQGESERGLGLLGMRERAELLGGRWGVESRVGQGTRVHVEILVKR